MYKFLIKTLTPFIKFFLRVEITGEVKIPQGEKFVICSNHISNWDPVLVVISTKIPINFLAKDSLFKIPILRNIVKSFGTIPLNRNAPDTASIRKSIEVINDGGCFSIFPQGKRIHDVPDLCQVKNGVGLICNKARAGVLPIGIYTNKYKIIPFRKIKISIGDYIPFETLQYGEGKPDYSAVSRQIFEKICLLAIPEESL